MNTNTVSTPESSSRTPKDQADSLVDALCGVGVAWAAYGLKVGKMALETSALTLEKTARALDTLAGEIAKKAPPTEPIDVTPAQQDDAPRA
jgi:hypothetical protein